MARETTPDILAVKRGSAARNSVRSCNSDLFALFQFVPVKRKD